jgi:hypothetical protein
MRLIRRNDDAVPLSNEGFMYCDRDETVLTWDAYSVAYARITTDFPWVLDAEDRERV